MTEVGETMEKVRGESDAEGEGEEDSMSEMYENSDTSLNSISSNNNIHQKQNNYDRIDDIQPAERNESPTATVLTSETLQSQPDDSALIENGSSLPSVPAVTVSTAMIKMELEENEDDSSDTTGSPKGEQKSDYESFYESLERDQQELSTLMFLKEREWNAILKLKKLKEIKMAKLKRQREVAELIGNCEDGDHRVEKIFKHISETDSPVVNKREIEVRNNIRVLEKEVDELTKEVLLDHHQKPGNHDTENSQVSNAFLASNALKSLVSRSRATITSNSIPASSGITPASLPPGKVIGEGRQGPIVEVSSLIADYRSKTHNDVSKQQPSSTVSCATLTPMIQPTTTSFTDLLSKLKLLYEKEKNLSSSPPAITINNTNKTVPAASKSKGNLTPTTSNSAATKPPVGTTLAKLLSANSVNSAGRLIDETLTYNHKSTSNNSAGSEKNLSLANLLASAKSRDETQKKKAETPAVPLCQGCHANKAQFVCAGCANQWYCSRECQVAAWDEHSDVCSG